MPIGVYTVQSTVTDALAYIASTSKQLAVDAGGPRSSREGHRGGAGSLGKFRSTLDATATTGGAPITSYSFDFGDGSAPVVVNASTAAPVARRHVGLYPVKVTVTDAWGRTQTANSTAAVGRFRRFWPDPDLHGHPQWHGRKHGRLSGYGTVKLHCRSRYSALHNPAIAIVLNVTVPNPTSGGYIAVFPDGLARPTSSNLKLAAADGAQPVTGPDGANGTVDCYVGGAEVRTW